MCQKLLTNIFFLFYKCKRTQPLSNIISGGIIPLTSCLFLRGNGRKEGERKKERERETPLLGSRSHLVLLSLSLFFLLCTSFLPLSLHVWGNCSTAVSFTFFVSRNYWKFAKIKLTERLSSSTSYGFLLEVKYRRFGSTVVASCTIHGAWKSIRR